AKPVHLRWFSIPNGWLCESDAYDGGPRHPVGEDSIRRSRGDTYPRIGAGDALRARKTTSRSNTDKFWGGSLHQDADNNSAESTSGTSWSRMAAKAMVIPDGALPRVA